MTFKAPAGLDQMPLHAHQIEAVRRTITYLRRRQPDDDSCALVQMPTGSGKTGIIAVLARMCPGINRTLVLAPRIAVRDQLIREIRADFFKKAGIQPSSRLVSKLTTENSGSSGPAVLVATVQQVDNWRRKKVAHYELLRGTLDLVVMDEGHYEPASSWSKTVREIAQPVLLLTATPYRNDLKTFRISQNGVSTLRFDEAVRKGVIRKVIVSERGRINDPNAFALDVISALNNLLPDKDRTTAKVIIRCDDAVSIRKLCQAFRSEGQRVVGIHEKFDRADQPSWLLKSVPPPDSIDAQIWIHQFKLLEGVDDPTFQIVGVFGDLMNVRALVQQVGRVIRNPGNKKGAQAYVLDHHNGALKIMWDQFLEYDKTVTAQQLSTSVASRVTSVIRTGFSGLEYFDKRFRTPFTFDDIKHPLVAFKLPREANLLRSENSSTEKVCKWLETQFREGDCESRRYDVGDSTQILFAYTRASNSNLLTDTYFLEARLGVVAATLRDGLLCFFDSGGLLPINAGEAGIYGVPQQSNLGKIIRDGGKSRISEISTRNSSVSRGTVRTRAATAASFEDLSPNLDDFQHVVTAMTGYSDEPGQAHAIRRYLGFTRGRVSQPGKPLPLRDYFKWTDEILARVKRTSAKPPQLMKRYSKELAKPPADPSPKNILIDFTEARELFQMTTESPTVQTDVNLEVEDACVDCTPTGPNVSTCEINTNSRQITVSIEYDTERHRYELTSDELDRTYSRKDGSSEGLVSWLNRHQSFNVIPESSGAMYVHGAFYNPQISTGDSFDPNDFLLAKVLHPITAFSDIHSEKGTRCKPDGSGWEDGCLFERIDALARGRSELSPYCSNLSALVCDDLSKESCDFFVADDQRIVMIHAKASPTPRPLSASALQEVTAQAIKNAAYVSMLSTRKPANLSLWPNVWRTGRVPSGEVQSRIRFGNLDADANWTLMEKMIRDPNTLREIWIVLGGTLSQSALFTELAKRKPAPQALQLVHLLLSCLAAVSSAGARLRVFCSP